MNKEKAPPKKRSYQGREVFHRMNYLYQIADMSRRIPGKDGAKLMIHFGSQLAKVGKRTNSRMDLSMKRTLCKGCNGILVPGDTARVRLLKKPESQLVWICVICGAYKSFGTKPGYQVWSEREEALVEVIKHETPNDPQPSQSTDSGDPNKNKCSENVLNKVPMDLKNLVL